MSCGAACWRQLLLDQGYVLRSIPTVPFESVVLLTPRFGSRLTAGQDHRTPGRYVGAEEVEEDAEPFGAKMKRLTHSCSSRRGRSWTRRFGRT
jgi:hypothetical protein